METNNWEQQFEEAFNRGIFINNLTGEASHSRIKYFIQQSLFDQKREILEKLTLEKQPYHVEGLPDDSVTVISNTGYNEAVSDLEALKATLRGFPDDEVEARMVAGEIPFETPIEGKDSISTYQWNEKVEQAAKEVAKAFEEEALVEGKDEDPPEDD
jgi:hypothetical protein